MVFVDSGNTYAYDSVDSADSEKYQGLAAQVFWEVTGAITLSADSIMAGKMKSNTAITMGAGAKTGSSLEAGRALTLGAGAKSGALAAFGAITLGAGAVAQSATGDAAITFGSCAQTLTMGAGATAAGHLAADLAGITLVPGLYTRAPLPSP